jgi:hypothetical protein
MEVPESGLHLWDRMSMAKPDLADLLFAINIARGRYHGELALAPASAQVYSQNGEDGIIAEIFRRIATSDRYFVEFGIENGLQNNTRWLLETGWRGVWIDANPEAIAQVREVFASFIESGQLNTAHAVLSAENINDVLDDAGVPERFDFLSADIDQNTSHVWRAIARRSRVACIEYNASVPASAQAEAPYDPTLTWDGTNWFGASLKALELIGREKGLSLVGCDLFGVNAFFVETSDARGRFHEPFTAEAH